MFNIARGMIGRGRIFRGARFAAPYYARGRQLAPYAKKAYNSLMYVAPAAAAIGSYIGNRSSGNMSRPATYKNKVVKVKRGYVASKQDGHNITKSSYTRIVNKTNPAIKEALPEVSRETGTTTVVASEGKQQIAEIASAWNGAELNGYASYSTSALTRFYVCCSELRMVYTNTTSTPVKLTLYDCRARAMGQAGLDGVVDGIVQGLKSKYNNAEQHLVPYQSPKESEHFGKFWKIINEKTIILSPGEVHEHYLKTDVNKYFENQDATSTNVSGSSTVSFHYIPPFTTVHFARLIGTPVTDGSLISTATSKVICMVYKKLTWKRPQGAANIQLLANQISTPATNLTVEKTMNEDTMAVTPNVTI